jgi:hypothetical protein
LESPGYAAQPANSEQPADCAAAADSERRGVHLTVGLATLLGRNDEPGDIGGWGSITATIARRLAAKQLRGEWRFAILDPDGRALSDGTTRHRPTHATGGEPIPGAIVELHLPDTLLTDPSLRAEHPDWAGLLDDLTRQHTAQRDAAQPGAGRPTPGQDPAARYPGRPLRRRVETRHRTCLFVGCRRPATDSHLDHRHDHATGGPTNEDNLAPACPHDHDLKTRKHWRLVRTGEHTYAWISPLGRHHHTHEKPIAPPLPPPTPRNHETDPDPPPF